jgi:arylsulfatase A-like enzyme
MRLLYVDIDTLRADHLGCYGYHRNTSPAIDAIAHDAIRFESVYASDTPCGPSRSALISGRFGIHNGVVGHGGTAADPFLEGAARGFQSRGAATSWARRMRSVGLHTATISSFGERHSAYHWDAGFNEVINLGTMGIETADQVAPLALDWLARNGARDNWFLHVHLWDPHTPYRTPTSYGEPFAQDPAPDWLT